MNRIKTAIVGLGKIARDQHLPSIAASDAFELIAVASPHSTLEGVPCFQNIEALLKAVPDVAAVALCTTPQVRYEAARRALEQGCHVLLEKPPGATISEVHALVELAQQRRVSLFASWHSRFAPAVEPARAWLATRRISGVSVVWKEDVRVWHPGQHWIWKGGGLGVFDPGINALSILTRIIPSRLLLLEAELSYPSNCETPIAARLLLADSRRTPIRAELDFRQTGPQSWDIEIETSDGLLSLSMGGSVMRVNGELVKTPDSQEYPRLYAHFATLVRDRSIDVDLAPFELVADALMCGRHLTLDPFEE
jgi:predicted dehydrogenase